MSQPLDTQIAQDARPVDKPRATFYQLLQMDARGLWAAIHAVPASRDKARLGFAMALRSILLVAFAILFIGVLTQLFGQNNTGLSFTLIRKYLKQLIINADKQSANKSGEHITFISGRFSAFCYAVERHF